MQEFFEEVDEELRLQKAIKLWKFYGKWVIIAGICVLFLASFYTWWQHYQEKQMAALSDVYFESLHKAQQGHINEAISDLEKLEKKVDTSFKIVVILQKAAFYKELYNLNNKDENALKHLQELHIELATNSKIEPFYQEFSKLLEAYGPFTTSHKEAVLKNLETLSQGHGGWHHLALEAMGALYLGDKNYTKAAEIFKMLSDDMTVSESINSRVEAIRSSLPKTTVKK